MGIPLDPLAPVWHYKSASEEDDILVHNPKLNSIQEFTEDEQADDALGLPLKLPNQEVIVHDLRGKDFTVKETKTRNRTRRD